MSRTIASKFAWCQQVMGEGEGGYPSRRDEQALNT
jgi:hypothetical protein